MVDELRPPDVALRLRATLDGRIEAALHSPIVRIFLAEAGGELVGVAGAEVVARRAAGDPGASLTAEQMPHVDAERHTQPLKCSQRGVNGSGFEGPDMPRVHSGEVRQRLLSETGSQPEPAKVARESLP